LTRLIYLKKLDRYHAMDTEATEIDLSKSAVGQGKIICASIFVGPDVDFGEGPKIWIDNLDKCEGLFISK